jgi:hypothetical protein
MKLRVGDWVEVRSKEEILSTLDKSGCMEGLPFMPQMFEYCGLRFRVYKRAHKTCDTVNKTGGRRLSRAVHLELRCDGEAYGGCQAACLLFWKVSWLRRIGGPTRNAESPDLLNQCRACSEADVWAGTQRKDSCKDDPIRYVCQATQLPDYTAPLPWWNVWQYAEDLTSRNVTIAKLIRGAVYSSFYHIAQAGLGCGRPIRWAYDSIQKAIGGVSYPRKPGKIPHGERTPMLTLDLQPGELVRIKPYQEILATLDTLNRNRGLYFDAEDVPYCGGTYRVRSRVDRYIDERTGLLKRPKYPAVILDGVWCQGRYSPCRMMCPRSIYTWWREIWLERVAKGDPSSS